MSEFVTNFDVIDAFKDAAQCGMARDCKKSAEAMCMFYRLDNQHTARTGEGKITFYSPPEGPCPNQDQLLCQDSIE